jgi:hypothetical protein
VGIHYDPGGGASPPVTSFSSTLFNTGAALCGTGFYAIFSKGNGSAGVNIDAQINPSAGGLVFGSGSGVNDNPTRVQFYPQTIDNTAMRAGCQTRGQFAQWTLVSRTAGIDCECPLVCFGDPSGNDGGYQLVVQSESTNVSVISGLGAVSFYNVRVNAFTCAPGDTVRMEVTFAAGANTIRTFKNGVLQSTDVDNNGARPLSGLAGFGLMGVFTGVLVFKDFSCGLL